MKVKSGFLTLAALALVSISPAQAQSADELMRVSSYQLVSSERIGRTTFEYEYAMSVENNTDTDYQGVFVTVLDAPDGVEIIDGRADIGAFNSFSQVAASDTIKVKVDRRNRFNPVSLVVGFDNDTLEGIDADDDGIRDDVEVFLETRGEPQYALEFIGKLYGDLLARDNTDADYINAYFRIADGFECIRLAGYSTDLLSVDAELLVFNSANRIRRKTEAENIISGESFEIPSDEDLQIFCSSLRQ